MTTQRIENILSVIANTQTAEEAAEALQNANPKLSKQASKNVIQDLQDFREEKMGLAELDYRLAEAGL